MFAEESSGNGSGERQQIVYRSAVPVTPDALDALCDKARRFGWQQARCKVIARAALAHSNTRAHNLMTSVVVTGPLPHTVRMKQLNTMKLVACDAAWIPRP